jgi:hypothetical protein
MAAASMATPSSITPAQQAFMDALKQKLNQQFSTLTNGKFETISVPDGFYWGIQFGPNNYYNKNSLNQMNLQAITASNGNLAIGNANFTTLYNSIMQAVVFDFSQGDLDDLAKDNAAFQAQIQAVINSWESDNGAPIAASDIATAVPKTKLGYIQAQVLKNWPDPRNIPSSMQSFKQAYQTFQTQAQVSNRLTTQSATAMNRVAAAQANSVAGTATNGGLQTDNSNYYPPFGPFPTQNKINSDLQTLSNKASIKIKLDNFSSQESHLSIESNVGFSIPIFDFIQIGVSGGSKYTVDKYASSKTVINMTIEYQGVTFVETPLNDSNLTTDNTKGWYANDVLTQAINNTRQGGQHPSKSGYTLQGTQFPVSDYFGPGKQFSRIKTWVLSQQPTITMQFCGAEASKIKTDFQQHSHVDVKLFGLFSIGSIDQSYQVTNVDDKSVAGCVSVTMGPSVIQGTTPAADARAYVIGGVPSYPPDRT